MIGGRIDTPPKTIHRKMNEELRERIMELRVKQ